jgi:hypothetical protein
MSNELELSQKIGEPSASIIKVASTLPPRDMLKVEKDIRAIATSNPEIAEQCIYCRPVGKKDGVQHFAFGPSIRLNEIGQQCFGRLWVNGVEEQSENRVKAAVMCFDLATLNITFGTCSKAISGKHGKYPQSLIETTTAAALSIARRNALTQQMRPQLDSILVDIKKTIIGKWCGGDITEKNRAPKLKEAWDKIALDFKKRWNILENMLSEVVANEDSHEDKLIYLIGIRNYLIENPDDIKDVFGKEPPQPQPKTPRQQYDSLKLLLQAKGKGDWVTSIINELSGIAKRSENDFNEHDIDHLIKLMSEELSKNG